MAQPSGRFSVEQIRSLVESISDMATALTEADPKLKQQVYEELGITVTYDPDRLVAKLESRPQIAWAKVCVGGGIRINSVGIGDAYAAWGSAHVGVRFGGDSVARWEPPSYGYRPPNSNVSISVQATDHGPRTTDRLGEDQQAGPGNR